MLYFCEFDNTRIGDYDVVLHASEDEMKKILDHFDMSWAVPDCFPAECNKFKIDLSMFFINSKQHEIVPVWAINYVYGHLYGGYGPVGEDLPEFSLILDDYTFSIFTPWEEEKIKRDKIDIQDWLERTRIFPYGKRRTRQQDRS